MSKPALSGTLYGPTVERHGQRRVAAIPRRYRWHNQNYSPRSGRAQSWSVVVLPGQGDWLPGASRFISASTIGWSFLRSRSKRPRST